MVQYLLNGSGFEIQVLPFVSCIAANACLLNSVLIDRYSLIKKGWFCGLKSLFFFQRSRRQMILYDIPQLSVLSLQRNSYFFSTGDSFYYFLAEKEIGISF